MHERLLTRDGILRFGVTYEWVCCLCLQRNESCEHLLFECSFSGCICTQALADLMHFQIHDLSFEVWQRDILQFKGDKKRKTELLIATTAISYSCWMERNRRLFQGIAKNIGLCKSTIAS